MKATKNSLKNRIRDYFGDENQTLLGSLLLYGFTDTEINQAVKFGYISYAGRDESIVYLNK